MLCTNDATGKATTNGWPSFGFGSFNRAQPTAMGGELVSKVVGFPRQLTLPSYMLLSALEKKTTAPAEPQLSKEERDARFRMMAGDFRYHLFKVAEGRTKLKLSPVQLSILAHLIEKGPMKHDDVPVLNSAWAKATLVEAGFATHIMVPGYRTINDIPTIAATPVGAVHFCRSFGTDDINEALSIWKASDPA